MIKYIAYVAARNRAYTVQLRISQANRKWEQNLRKIKM